MNNNFYINFSKKTLLYKYTKQQQKKKAWNIF